jgi:hypothetical protein
MDALLSMLQQMQMPSGPSDQSGLDSSQPVPQPSIFSRQGDLRRDSYAPVTVLELAHDDPANGPSSSPPSVERRRPLPKSAVPRPKSMQSASLPMLVTSDRDWSTFDGGISPANSAFSSSPKLEQQLGDPPAKQIGASPVAIPNMSADISAASGVNPANHASTARTIPNGIYDFPLDSDLGPSGIAPGEDLVTDVDIATDEHLLDDLLDLENTVELFPPLTDLPQGTDIGALARQIEGLTSVDESDAV